MRYLFVALTISLSLSAQIKINEVMSDNYNFGFDPDFKESFDWIELINPDSTFVNISGWAISDDTIFQDASFFPPGTIISSNGFRIIFADGNDTLITAFHANFKISKSGESIFLFNQFGDIVDSVAVPEIPRDISYGFVNGDFSNGKYFIKPTIRQQNDSIFFNSPHQTAGALSSISSGIYSSTQFLNLYSLDTNASIYYETDGKIPNKNSAQFTSVLQIDSSTIIRARAFSDSLLPSEVLNLTIIIDSLFNLPIVSLITSPDNLFDSIYGIHVNGINFDNQEWNTANFAYNWDRPFFVEYFEKNQNSPEFSIDSDVRIAGFTSRKMPMKSFKIKAENSDDYLEYKFFESKNNERFKSIILRNFGGDQRKAFIRDALMANLVSENPHFDYNASTAAIVFLNGNFWGLFNIRENIDDSYIESNYGIAEGNFDLISQFHEAEYGTNTAYFDLLKFCYENDLNTNTNYSYIKSQIDIDNYIDYNVAEIHSGNWDWLDNNIRFWKPRNFGKWRWILFDTDVAYRREPSINIFNQAIEVYDTSVTGIYPMTTLLFRELLQSNNFKKEFAQRFAVHLHSYYNADRIISKTDSLANLIRPYVNRHLEIWGGVESPFFTSPMFSSEVVWEAYINYIKFFANQRNQYIYQQIDSSLSLDSLFSLSFDVFPNNSGKILFHDVEMKIYPDTILLFRNVDIRIKAQSKFGHKFSHWSTGDTLNPLTLSFSNDTNIIAFFIQQTVFPKIYINEFLASNQNDIQDNYGENDDWVELYNNEDYPVNIGGWYISDDSGNPSKFQFSNTSPQHTTIQAKDFILLWADNDTQQGELHLNFKLSKSGEEIILAAPDSSSFRIIDEIDFGNQSNNISYARYKDGMPYWYYASTTTPNLPNSYFQPDTQIIIIDSNWSMFSTAIIPENSSHYAFFNFKTENIIVVKNHFGEVFFPGMQVQSIKKFDCVDAYKIKMHKQDTFYISGRFIIPENYEKVIPSGWSYIGTPYATKIALEDLFSDISQNIEIVKSDYTEVFYPDLLINQIDTIYPTEGFYIKMKQADTLRFIQQ